MARPISFSGLQEETGSGLPLSEVVSGESDDPLETLEERCIAGLITESVQLLPERNRKFVELYYFEGLKQIEIAERYGLTLSRVSQILTESRKRLKDIVSRHFEPQI